MKLNKNVIKVLLAFFISLVVTQATAQTKWREFYQNPVITGFNPDPSICKVGEDYYLVTSTFEYFPGVPIYHSTDLVNWEHIGNVLDRPSQLNLDNYDCSMGIFAPCIRYHEGTFYMITTLVGKGGGNFIVTAKDPRGPWSEPHFIKGTPGIDPDLLFDDNGKVYMSGTFKPRPEDRAWPGHNTIWTQEIDLEKWEVVGERVTTVDGGVFFMENGPMMDGNPNNLNAIEGPHFYKKDGTYYATFSIGGTDQLHGYAIMSSDHIFGPYVENPNNPILTHRDLSPYHAITATGHADLFQIDGDQWGIVHLGKRPIYDEKPVFWRSKNLLGRESFFEMVDWSGEWPIVNPEGQVGRSEMILLKPDLTEKVINKNHWKDDFEADKLHQQWLFLRTPRTEWWSLKKGQLAINLRPETVNEKVNPSFIGKRQEHHDFSVTTKMTFAPKSENEEAGLLLERNANNYLKYTIAQEGEQKVLRASFRCGDAIADSIIAKTPIDAKEIYLKQSGVGTLYSFSYSLDNKNWITLFEGFDILPTPFLDNAPFTGPIVGMYASSNGQQSKTVAYFDWFYYNNY